jgi:hypothetical protein
VEATVTETVILWISTSSSQSRATGPVAPAALELTRLARIPEMKVQPAETAVLMVEERK